MSLLIKRTYQVNKVRPVVRPINVSLTKQINQTQEIKQTEQTQEINVTPFTVPVISEKTDIEPVSASIMEEKQKVKKNKKKIS